MPSARRAIAALAATALALTACNGGEPEATETTTAEAGSTTMAPPTTDEVQHLYLTDPKSWLAPGDERSIPPEKLEPVLAYVRAEQAWIRAGMAPVNPDSPDLAATTGEKLLESVQRALRDQQAARQVNAPPIRVQALAKRFLVEEQEALLDLCVAQHVPVYDLTTGSTVEDRRWSADFGAQLKRRGSGWILTGLERISDYREGELCGSW